MPPFHLQARLVAPKKSCWRGATFAKIRNVYVKIAVRVQERKPSMKLAFPCHLPNADVAEFITRRLTALGL